MAQEPAARAIVDTAAARMGGIAALRAVRTVKLDMMTQWLSLSFDERPFTDGPSYELHFDQRDYATKTWRNTRRFGFGPNARDIIDLVIDTVGGRFTGPAPAGVVTGPMFDGWVPLNAAYIDERRQIFAFTPDRLVLALHEAKDLRARADTTIGGIRHAVVSATVDGIPATVFFRRTDGLPAFARYHADESNDFGLAPWGPMDVEWWYSRWRNDPRAGITFATQLDVKRVGRPYKRMTVLAATLNAPLAADSLVLNEGVRGAFTATSHRAMGDLPLDSARLAPGGRIALFGVSAGPTTAVKLGSAWLLIEPGNLPLNAERATQWLADHDAGAKVAGGLLMAASPSGGASWLAKRRLPVYAAPAIERGVTVSLRNWGAPVAASRVISRGQWIKAGGDSAWVEPIDFPNMPGALLIHVPSMQWVYATGIATPLELAIVRARVKERGWTVDRIGGPRAPAGMPLP
jgi:hypothetical protein